MPGEELPDEITGVQLIHDFAIRYGWL